MQISNAPRRLSVIALLHFAIFVFVTPVNAAIIGTDSFNGHIYHLLDGKPWLAQEAEAIELNGHLVTINDAAENEWVWDTFGSFGQGLFFGLNDFVVEGTWVWASGGHRRGHHCSDDCLQRGGSDLSFHSAVYRTGANQ